MFDSFRFYSLYLCAINYNEYFQILHRLILAVIDHFFTCIITEQKGLNAECFIRRNKQVWKKKSTGNVRVADFGAV